MERYRDQVAFVTGANGGIGSTIVEKLVQAGLRVVGFDKSLDKVQELAQKLNNGTKRLHPLEGDITKEDDVISAFQWVDKNVGKLSILINNAGIAVNSNVSDFELEKWVAIYKVNVFGMGMCSREAIKSMRNNMVKDGHIINLNSMAGHHFPTVPGISVYSMTKHDVTNLTKCLRKELLESKTNVKITSLSPGWVKTGMALPFFEKNPNEPGLKPEDIADAILYILSVPPHVNIHELSIAAWESS